jgi:ketosteroid isomerase-like protein
VNRLTPLVRALVAISLVTLPPASSAEGRNRPAVGSDLESARDTADRTASRGANAAQQVQGLEARVAEAVVKRDMRFLETHLAEDYIAIRADGKLGMRAQELESLSSGHTKFESYDVRELKVRVYGDAAVVTLLFSVTATINGRPYSGDARATRVWVREKDSWKLVTHQATRVVPASQ